MKKRIALLLILTLMAAILSALAEGTNGEPTAEALLAQAKARQEAGDYSEAVSLLQKAAELGNSYSIYMIGECYYLGNGVEKDLEQAAVWFRKARDLGYMPVATEEERKRMEDVLGAQAESGIPFRFASREEGAELMLANDEYYAKFSPNKIGYVMQNNDATMEEYLAFAREQVLDWTDEEKDAITRGMKRLEDTFAERVWMMPPLDTIVFIRTTMDEENGVMGYTHGTQIYLGDIISSYFLGKYDAAEPLPDRFETLLAHELFHCLTRCNPDFREKMYRLIHFTVVPNDYPIPPSVWDYYIVNPDVEHHNSWATFEIDGKKIDCFAAFVTTKHFENAGERFFDYGTTALVPVDGSDVYYPKDQVSNFDEVFGTNTGYVIDPEECMADNFSDAVVFGMNGPTGNGYHNPEIIEGIFEILGGK